MQIVSTIGAFFCAVGVGGCIGLSDKPDYINYHTIAKVMGWVGFFLVLFFSPN